MDLLTQVIRPIEPSVWSLVRVTAPASEPVTLAEAQSWLRVDSNDDSTEIETLIQVAREMVENATGRALISQTWKLSLSQWPETRTIDLPTTPLVSVETVKYYPADGGAQATLASSKYHVVTGTEPGRVVLKANELWPDEDDRPDAVEVSFTSGWANAAAVPATLRHAMLFTLTHLYENRATVSAGTTTEIPFALKHLLESQRVGGWIG